MDNFEIERIKSLKENIKSLSKSPISIENFNEISSLNEEIILLERDLSRKNGRQFATPMKQFPSWIFSNFHLPWVISSPLNTGIIYQISPLSKGENIDEGPDFQIVIFKNFVKFCFGSPNDETIEGHELWGSGIEPGGFYLVENSLWIKSMIIENRIHSDFEEEKWLNKKHFLLFFKDVTFQCISEEWESVSIKCNNYKIALHRAMDTIL